MAKASHRDKDAEPDVAINESIAYAEKYAGDDDSAFVRAFHAHYQQASAPVSRGGGRAAPAAAARTPVGGFEITDDPRYQANTHELARRTAGGLRVIGGKLVPAGQFLDCVAVGSDTEWGCTGTLIAPNVVVTAGHCANFATRVYFGNDVSKPGRIVGVVKRLQHPDYYKVKHNDLMVLLLAEDVTDVAARRLASKSILDKATDGRVVGFGNTDPGGMFGYGKKRYVDVPIASTACRGQVDGRDDKVLYGCDAGLELVAGRPLLEQDSCNGDSGGPFYVQGPNKAWLLGGATSRATEGAMHNCGDGGIYVRLDRYRAWIDGIQGVALPK
jgi:secreted trypsin-like serine protease